METKKIWVVDDEKEIVEAIKLELEENPYEVLTAHEEDKKLAEAMGADAFLSKPFQRLIVHGDPAWAKL